MTRPKSPYRCAAVIPEADQNGQRNPKTKQCTFHALPGAIYCRRHQRLNGNVREAVRVAR